MSEIRVDNIRSQSGASSPSFPHGANVTGVVTATTFSGDLPEYSSLSAINPGISLSAIEISLRPNSDWDISFTL